MIHGRDSIRDPYLHFCVIVHCLSFNCGCYSDKYHVVPDAHCFPVEAEESCHSLVRFFLLEGVPGEESRVSLGLSVLRMFPHLA